MERNSFIFYKSFYEASKYLPNEEKGKLFDMICQYWLYWNEIEWEWASMWMFLLIKPQLDANNKRYENWCKWWAPEWNQNAVKTWKNNTKQPKNNQKQPNDNVNDNVNVNENENETITNSNTEQSSENQKENNSLSLNNSHIEEKEKSSAKKEKEITAEINDLINQIKNVCDELWVAYNKDMERQFSKHILTAKEYWEFCEKIGQTRVEFALNVLRVSVAIKYFRWALSWPKSIYKNYAELYNQAKSKMQKTITPKINVL